MTSALNTQPYHGRLAVLDCGQEGSLKSQQLAEKLGTPLRCSVDENTPEQFFLIWREGALKLIDRGLLAKGGLAVNVEPRKGEQRSWPAPKQGALAQAIGRKTVTVVDATTGWGQDSLALFRMGFQMHCIERSPVMAELLADGFGRLAELEWLQKLQLKPPRLIPGDAIEELPKLAFCPDCVFLDPMFPAKRKKSALAKKAMEILPDLLGEDADKRSLFDVARQVAGHRVVVKSPTYAEPLGGKPDVSHQSKLLRYDVYFR